MAEALASVQPLCLFFLRRHNICCFHTSFYLLTVKDSFEALEVLFRLTQWLTPA